MKLGPSPIFTAENPAADGPSLHYHHSDRQCVTTIDRGAVTDPRERAICRALLVHALALLDAEDASLNLPTLPYVPEEERP
ncbi:hypothetical protein [Streptomyces olivaceiscleroticus]|uniref:Uncharacterized protein n=1 Tax=Streptomyces olivaceiscleroticus TaxID=68245 RepID=A0ABN1BNI3_9ACTN